MAITYRMYAAIANSAMMATTTNTDTPTVRPDSLGSDFSNKKNIVR